MELSTAQLLALDAYDRSSNKVQGREETLATLRKGGFIDQEDKLTWRGLRLVTGRQWVAARIDPDQP